MNHINHYGHKNHCNDNCNDFSDYNDIIAPMDKLIMLHYSQKIVVMIIEMIFLTMMTLSPCPQGCNNVTL